MHTSLARWIERESLEVVTLMTCDLNGFARGKQLAARRFVSDPATTMHLPELVTALDYDSHPLPPPPQDTRWWPGWGSGFPDVHAVLDATTARRIPWRPRSGLVLCDLAPAADPAVPFTFLPRRLLARVVAHAAALGFETRAAHEIEFTLFEDGKPLWTTPRAYDLGLMERHAGILGALRTSLEALALPVESCGVEAGPGQLEFNLAPTDALGAADRGFLLKYAVRAVAAAQGLEATFMAQHEAGGFGNGNHVNLSLWRGGENAFCDATRPGRRSHVMEQFIAGVVATLPELTLLYAPTVNAYRRFVPDHLAGLVVAWGEDNKTLAVRSVCASPALTRVEQRTGGADANPYLIMAACLAAGLHGIEAGLAAPPPTCGDAGKDPRLARVPATLEEAVARFSDSTCARVWFGEDFVRLFVQGRRIEAAAAAAADDARAWERARYFATV